MFVRKICLGSLTVLLALVCQAPSQVAKRHCHGAGTTAVKAEFDDSYSSAAVSYQVEQPHRVSNRRIEVWDRPTLVFRTQVTNEKSGKVVWRPKEELPDTPFALWMKVGDPSAVRAGGESRVLIGGTGNVVPELLPENVILEEDSGTTYLALQALIWRTIIAPFLLWRRRPQGFGLRANIFPPR